MLTEVKKEVDIMVRKMTVVSISALVNSIFPVQRLLKGHPNIVHFIDASWHKLPNGSYEVFILMEYCPGKA
jgi:AP2-associated kinase